MTAFMTGIGALYVDHMAVTTPVFEETVRDYLAMPGARLHRGPGFNHVQNVRYAFVRIADGMVVEVLGLPEDGDGPIAQHVKRGGGAYHLCYAVADIEASISAAVAAGARLVVPPKPDPAHDERPVAFLMHAAHGMVELVAAYPADLTVPASAPAIESPANASQAGDGDEVARGLAEVFAAILPKLGNERIAAARLGVSEGWDSLAQLQLAMGVEQRFGVRIPMSMIERLTSYEAYADYLTSITKTS